MHLVIATKVNMLFSWESKITCSVLPQFFLMFISVIFPQNYATYIKVYSFKN